MTTSLYDGEMRLTPVSGTNTYFMQTMPGKAISWRPKRKAARCIRFIVAVGACLVYLGASAGGQTTANPSVSQQADPSYGSAQVATQSVPANTTQAITSPGPALVIGNGDTLNVVVFDTPTLSFQGRVDEAGSLNAPVLGSVSVAGLTTDQAARKFESLLLERNIMRQPSVTVTDSEFATQGIVVLGEVHTPGTYTLLGPHNLYDALSAAGGASDTEGPKITITHRGDPEHPEEIPVNSANFSELQRTTRVYPGDTIFVSKAEMVYIVGDVGHPGAYYMQHGKPLTILNLVALAQGDNVTAADRKASIVRTTASGVTTIPVDLRAIKRNQIPDITLKGDDVFVLPRSTSKLLLTQILPGTSVAVASAVASALIVR